MHLTILPDLQSPNDDFIYAQVGCIGDKVDFRIAQLSFFLLDDAVPKNE